MRLATTFHFSPLNQKAEERQRKFALSMGVGVENPDDNVRVYAVALQLGLMPKCKLDSFGYADIQVDTGIFPPESDIFFYRRIVDESFPDPFKDLPC